MVFAYTVETQLYYTDIWAEMPLCINTADWFQIIQQLEGICLQVIGTVLQQHVLGEFRTLMDKPVLYDLIFVYWFVLG